MASKNRIEQINSQIMRVLSDSLRNIKDPRVSQGLVSIVRVDTTSDLSLCRIYVSLLNGDAKDLAKGLKSASGYLRREVASQLTLRHTPELQFICDDSISEGVRILDKINNLKYSEEE